MELQRHALLMYTSCGWFYDDISGIETIQILQYAGRAIQLGEELFGRDNIETDFLALLQNAASNDPQIGNGRDLYMKFVRPARIDGHKAVGHYAVSSLFQDYPEQSELYAYIVDREYSRMCTSGLSRLAVGRCRIKSKMTEDSLHVEYAVVQLGDHNISGGVRDCNDRPSAQESFREMVRAFEKGDLPTVFRILDEDFSQSAFSLGSLFKDEQRRVLDILLKAANADLEDLNRQAFERTAPLMRFLTDMELTPPSSFRNIAASVLNTQLLHALESERFQTDQIAELLESAAFWRVELDKEGLEFALRRKIETLAQKSRENPGDLAALNSFSAAVQLASRFPFTVNLYRTQNTYYEILSNSYPGLKAAAAKGDKGAKAWIEAFRELGAKLSVRVE